jgi:hypothetical protein
MASIIACFTSGSRGLEEMWSRLTMRIPFSLSVRN